MQAQHLGAGEALVPGCVRAAFRGALQRLVALLDRVRRLVAVVQAVQQHSVHRGVGRAHPEVNRATLLTILVECCLSCEPQVIKLLKREMDAISAALSRHRLSHLSG